MKIKNRGFFRIAYLFAGSHEGARRAAILYSLLGTCKLQGINPQQWLRDVITRIPEHPVDRVKELLPHKWKSQNNPSHTNA